MYSFLPKAMRIRFLTMKFNRITDNGERCDDATIRRIRDLMESSFGEVINLKVLDAYILRHRSAIIRLTAYM